MSKITILQGHQSINWQISTSRFTLGQWFKEIYGPTDIIERHHLVWKNFPENDAWMMDFDGFSGYVRLFALVFGKMVVWICMNIIPKMFSLSHVPWKIAPQLVDFPWYMGLQPALCRGRWWWWKTLSQKPPPRPTQDEKEKRCCRWAEVPRVSWLSKIQTICEYITLAIYVFYMLY